MSDPILTPEQVARVYEREESATVDQLARSHEALRSRLAEAEAERDAAKRERDTYWQAGILGATDKRAAEAALAEAEAERDDLRASRESWVTARAEVISLDLAASRAALAEAVELLRQVLSPWAISPFKVEPESVVGRARAFIEAHG